mmetsp:Transcript_549/g.1133  ORF Transcript_549/g.1133 Transcript_549/m.1133 type:complete len:224 (-) Transcript_549:991-1662(-)
MIEESVSSCFGLNALSRDKKTLSSCPTCSKSPSKISAAVRAKLCIVIAPADCVRTRVSQNSEIVGKPSAPKTLSAAHPRSSSLSNRSKSSTTKLKISATLSNLEVYSVGYLDSSSPLRPRSSSTSSGITDGSSPERFSPPSASSSSLWPDAFFLPFEDVVADVPDDGGRFCGAAPGACPPLPGRLLAASASFSLADFSASFALRVFSMFISPCFSIELRILQT